MTFAVLKAIHKFHNTYKNCYETGSVSSYGDCQGEIEESDVTAFFQ